MKREKNFKVEVKDMAERVIETIYVKAKGKMTACRMASERVKNQMQEVWLSAEEIK